ncbi:HlyD family secretion protein [Tundrisphaera lichenicola]|uniref:HlyD family secretion protein n=1 Tax=Tundrisphaera lichenicola TaxID=2029860 RepID=UPI003EBB46CE
MGSWKSRTIRIPSSSEIIPLALRALRVAKGLPRLAVRIALANSWISLTLTVAAATIVALLIIVVMPGYANPMSRLYTSKFGYGTILRKLKKPFPVTATRATRRVLSRTCLGEGLVRSEPLIVSIVPMGTIVKMHVKDGDLVQKGQLLAEVDSTKAEIKANAARAALETANAELARVKIGSAYVLTYERPRRDQIRLDAAEKEYAIQKQLFAIQDRLNQKGYLRREESLKLQIAMIQAEATILETRFNLEMSSKGVSQSVLIAEAAVKEAELALEHRIHELKDYKVYSIADGRLERCLVHEGEYNQDPGKPGFVIASGAWFEANFDQGSFRRIKLDDPVDVRLEASPDRVLHGRITWINPFVSYDLGGPESTRPIRPMGTGAPEWPATFVVKVQVDRVEGIPVLPGMTGFAVVLANSEALSLPREAVFAITAGKGLVYLVDGDRPVPREVTLGIIDGDYIEVRDGLGPGEVVVLDGHQILEPGDTIRIIPDPKGDPNALPGLASDGRPRGLAPAGGDGQALDVGPDRLRDQARR